MKKDIACRHCPFCGFRNGKSQKQSYSQYAVYGLTYRNFWWMIIIRSWLLFQLRIIVCRETVRSPVSLFTATPAPVSRRQFVYEASCLSDRQR